MRTAQKSCLMVGSDFCHTHTMFSEKSTQHLYNSLLARHPSPCSLRSGKSSLEAIGLLGRGVTYPDVTEVGSALHQQRRHRHWRCTTLCGGSVFQSSPAAWFSGLGEIREHICLACPRRRDRILAYLRTMFTLDQCHC